uniref:Fibronectin type-III domain-containing protein n=1 Tax=Oryzias melastigma TaxID=30732 RepID=A0A3B3BWR1_ORYME
MALVTWEHSGPDQTQVVTATDNRGLTATCNSSSSNCTFNQLNCGSTYAISVVGHTNSCSSEPTVAQALQTAPCVPTHVKAIVNCAVNITMVTWDSALGATSYTVYARGSLGHSAKCNSTSTECNFFDLGCGQDYIMTVVAYHDTCSSLVSEAINVTTGPCPYSSLKAALDCNTNTIEVSWTPGRGILYYDAEARPFNSVPPRECSSNGTSCNISSLQCGETYSVSVTGQGENCPSPSNFWHKIITAPCPPTNMRVDSSCASNNITVSWEASQGSVSYMAVAENAKGDQWSCNTSSTTCQIPDLLCGQEYKVFVAGVDQNCFGARSNMKTIHTAPCVPENIQDHLDCPSGVLNITWESTGHFVQFHASLRSQSGHVTGCTTDEPYCVVHDMHCDMTYEVTVQAQDENCYSSLSSVKSVIAAPCPLSSFLPVIDCATGVASITWSTNVTGLVHSVTAVNAAGEMHNCSGTNIGCDLSSLKCGTEYNVTITPSRNKCVGKASSTERIQTVPCVPYLSDVEMDCLANSAWVTFNTSAGAEDYIIMASNSFGAVQTFECNSTSDGTCALPPLPCSQNLTFTLMAQDQQCISSPSNAITVETAPCPPDNINEWVNCENGTMTITWSAVPGAVTYTAMLEEINGGKPSCCTTTESGCEIPGLPCGEMYILHVTAEGRTCNSSESQGLITRTVACVPENLDATLRCSNNVASMSWGFSNGGQLYTVTAVGTDGHVDQCRSLDNKCDLINLHCGEHYTATVTAEDMECKSKPSESVTIKTVPCTPANVSSVMDCEANALIVSWSESSGADSYIASLRDSNDQTTTCLGTTTGSCNVTGLGCSQIYQASVVSSDGYCSSPPSVVVETPSAPCKPRYIKAMMDCYTRTAEVSWYPSIGALSYEVLATSVSGSNATCDTNMTTCTLEELLCGQSYSVSVKAIGESCNSIADMTGPLVTEPCIPEHITAQYSLTIGQVQWDLASGAENYTVTGETDQGLIVSCATSDTYCALYNMGCGQIYNITVAAHNAVCNDVSVSAVAATIMTEPCPPNEVQTSVDCRTDQGTVSWETSFGAIGYEAKLSGRDGHSLTCYTNDTFCSVESLHCGVIYYTTVIAIGETLNSSMSTPVLLISAPCTAGSVAANLDCYNSTAEVSWRPGIGASSYIVTAVGTDGFVASCATNEFHCNLTELQCGQVYNVTLTTVSEQCQIESYTNVSFGSRPCEPLRVEANMQCGRKTANLTWEESDGVELYLTTATSRTGTTLHCNSTEPTCHFSGLKCGEIYEFSVTAYSNMCYSDTSSTVEIQTEPCQPTGLTITGSCNDETVMLNWSKAKGAIAYVVTATGNLGYIESLKTNDTTIDVDLPCGQLFTFTVTALDNSGCDGTVSAPEQFKTGPCVPEYVNSFTQCEDNLGSVGWVMGAKADSYLAIAMGEDGHTHQCTTNTTTCTWTDLHCGEVYTVNVIALDYKCASVPSNSTTIKMAPCVPQNLEYSFNCTTKVGSMTWNESKAAEFYIATAETNSGHKIQLSTNETWTFISEFLCGQEYFLSVQAADSVCTSRASPPSKLTSEPCPPTDVSSHMNCISHIAMVSWTGSAGAEFYTTTVKPMDGESKSCWSDREKCSMPHVPCGQNYTVTVIASNKMCDSDPSAADVLQSVPCVPADVEVKVNCSNNQAVVSWSTSNGALSYKVVAESTQNDRIFCETTELTCTLTNLTCGHPYSVQVVAEGETCSSLPSQDVEFSPVPCTPKMGSVILDCYTNSALLDWKYAEGALYYTATAQSSSGHVSTCNSNFTNCELQNLQCGQIYNMVTLASNDECSSPPSTSLEVESVPCPPEDVVPVLDCSSNTAHVEWRASTGAESYIVQAFGVEEHETGCVTDSEFCVLTDLMCGFTYNISVIAINSVCNVSQSDVEQLQAAPCMPEQVEARVDCESGGVMVSWEPSKGALSYTTVAQGSAGYNSTCSNTETTCLLDDLLRGLNYTITVIASDDVCNSTESSVVEIGTVPCVPQHVTAEMVCSNDTGVVSWEEGEGVTSYQVLAYGPDGHKTECHSRESSCELLNMHCGQLYNVTITAQDGRCDNSNAFLNLMSVPCRPTNIKAMLHCLSNSAAVTWEKASGALTYVAVGVTKDGSHWTECNNTETHCDLRDLQCGQIYNVSVFGQDESCSSVVSDRAYVRTAPCPPQNVVVDAQCAKGEMVVSWSPNTDAQYFHVAAVSNTGARLYCNSTGTTCTISNLPCGQHYNVTVLSVRDTCESKTSPVVHTCSAPCVPMKPEGRLDCVSNSVWVSWNPSQGAASYFVHAEAADGHNSNCTTSSSTCSVPDLKCGTQYTFNVIGVNQHCSSNHSTTFQIETGPCALESVKATTGCNNNTILVEWERTQGTPVYVVTAEADDKTFLSCNTSSVSCVLQDVQCGTNYRIIVSTSSDKCSSLRSPPKKIETAPCAPRNVSVVPLCETNGAAVSWEKSMVATSYQLTATGPDGHVATCNTSVNNCSLDGLHCGQKYSLNITASGATCRSLPSLSSFKTVPCPPVNPTVEIDCQTNSGKLSWNSTERAVEYISHAASMNGKNLFCSSASSSCTFENLECGDIYNFTIKSFDGFCNSSSSPTVQAGAVPCPPPSLKVRMQRIKKMYWAMISWDRVNCSKVEYLTKITGKIGNNPQALMDVSSYWWDRPYFELPMPCSTTFNITVQSKNSAGVGKPSSIYSGITAPCAPQMVQYIGSMQSVVLSWNASVFATNYMVYNVSGGSRAVLCNTTGLSCQITNFDPSFTEVTAVNKVGESNPSQNITGLVGGRKRRAVQDNQGSSDLGEVLEVPEVLTVTVSKGSLHVKWRKVKDATEYTVMIEEEQTEELPGQPPRVEMVEGDYYEETGLKASTTYCVRVAARNAVNQSSYSWPKCRNTGSSL